jgi:hypothetical protein
LNRRPADYETIPYLHVVENAVAASPSRVLFGGFAAEVEQVSEQVAADRPVVLNAFHSERR